MTPGCYLKCLRVQFRFLVPVVSAEGRGAFVERRRCTCRKSRRKLSYSLLSYHTTNLLRKDRHTWKSWVSGFRVTLCNKTTVILDVCGTHFCMKCSHVFQLSMALLCQRPIWRLEYSNRKPSGYDEWGCGPVVRTRWGYKALRQTDWQTAK